MCILGFLMLNIIEFVLLLLCILIIYKQTLATMHISGEVTEPLNKFNVEEFMTVLLLMLKLSVYCSRHKQRTLPVFLCIIRRHVQ